MKRLPRDIYAQYQFRRNMSPTASVCLMLWGLEVTFAAEKCAPMRAKVATGEIG